MGDIDKWFMSQQMLHFRIDEDCIETECPQCGSSDGTIKRRRRNSSYVDDDNNWMISCQNCFDEDYQELSEMWEDYYRGCL